MSTKRETTRSQILGAAYRLFLEKGYSATSMRDIVAASGITMGGIYNHFAGKEQIFSAVFAEYNPIRQVLPAMLEAEGDTLEAVVHDSARRMIQGLGDKPEVLNLMFTEIVEFRAAHFEAALEVGFPEVMRLPAGFMRFRGQVRSIPPLYLARSFIGLFFSFYMTSLILPGRFQALDEDLRQFVDIYLHGILEQP
jgi:AcrR family transcriptional regulator